MNEIKIIHTADLHLGSSRAAVSTVDGFGRGELLNTFFRIIEICKTENADFLLIAGDLFDTPFTDDETVREVIGAIASIPDTVVAISAGNHDCASHGSVYTGYKFPENTVLFTSEAKYTDFPKKGVRLFGAGFSNIHADESLLNSPCPRRDGYISLGVLHGDLAGNGSFSQYNPISAEQIANSGLDYLALGHIHKRSEISKVGKTYFSYCGCPDGRGFDEDGSRGVYLCRVGVGECKAEYIETSSRLYLHENVDISTCQSSHDAAKLAFKELTAKYTNISRSLLKLSLCGTLSSDISFSTRQIEAYLSEHMAYCRVTDNTEVALSELEKLANEVSLRGIFVKKMLERIAAAEDSERDKLRRAMRIGIRAFEKGVGLNDY